jgi:hypothetical protein
LNTKIYRYVEEERSKLLSNASVVEVWGCSWLVAGGCYLNLMTP